MKQRYKIIITLTITIILCLMLSSCEGIINNKNSGNQSGPVLCIHEYEESTVREATCTEEGELMYKCRKCGDSYNEPIPARGHDMQLIEATESVCVEESKRVYKCSRCDYTVTETQPPAYEVHDHRGKIEVEPTCTKSGTIRYTCSRCGDTYTESLSRLEHSWEPKSNTLQVCTKCGQECSYPEELGFDGVVALYEEMRADLIANTSEDELANADPTIGNMWVEYSTYTPGKNDTEKGLMIFVRAEYMQKDQPQLIERERIHPFRLSIVDGKWQFINPELIELKDHLDAQDSGTTEPEGNTTNNTPNN